MGFFFYPAVFAGAGVIVGLLVSVLLFYLSELGKNIKKTTEATEQMSRGSVAAELKQYKELLDSGAITPEEYGTKKKQILS